LLADRSLIEEQGYAVRGKRFLAVLAVLGALSGHAAATAVGDAISALDRAASKGVIHRNNAARRKSRLMAKYNALGK